MQIEDRALTITRAELRAVLAHASTDECRVNLHAVQVDPARRTLAVTDGHRLLAVTADLPEGALAPTAQAITMPRAFLEPLAKGKAKESLRIEWSRDGALTAKVGGVTYTGQASEHAFPPWRAVLPSGDGERADTGDFNPAYLADLALFCAAGVTSVSITLFAASVSGRADIADHPCPAVLRGRSDDAQWRLVLMPMRISKGLRRDEWDADRVPIALGDAPASAANAA